MTEKKLPIFDSILAQYFTHNQLMREGYATHEDVKERLEKNVIDAKAAYEAAEKQQDIDYKNWAMAGGN